MEFKASWGESDEEAGTHTVILEGSEIKTIKSIPDEAKKVGRQRFIAETKLWLSVPLYWGGIIKTAFELGSALHQSNFPDASILNSVAITGLGWYMGNDSSRNLSLLNPLNKLFKNVKVIPIRTPTSSDQPGS